MQKNLEAYLPEVTLNFKDHLRYERRNKANTIHNYVTYVSNIQTFTGKSMAELTREDIRAFIKDLEDRKFCKSSISNYVIAWRSYYSWLGDKTRDPEIIAMSFFLTKIIKIKKDFRVTETPSMDEVNRLRQTLNAYKAAMAFNRKGVLYRAVLRDIALIELLATAGLRSNELRNLRRDEVDLEENVLFVRVGKGDRQRVSLFGNSAKIALEEYFKEHDFAPSANIMPKRGNMINYIIRRWAKRAGINEKIHAHSFRHFFITESLYQGIPIESVADQVGHVNINTTRGYNHSNVSTLKAKYKNFNSERNPLTQ